MQRIKSMKVLIQESSTKRYLSPRAVWVKDPEEAEDFQTFNLAYEFAAQFVKDDFEVLYFWSECSFRTGT